MVHWSGDMHDTKSGCDGEKNIEQHTPAGCLATQFVRPWYVVGQASFSAGPVVAVVVVVVVVGPDEVDSVMLEHEAQHTSQRVN